MVLALDSSARAFPHPSREWSNLAKVVYRRTYSRKDTGTLERWPDTVERVLGGNIRGHNLSDHEIARLRYFLTERKAGPAGRGWWFSGAPAHAALGGAALVNCWHLSCDDWRNYVTAQDVLMLGGGVGMSVEHRFVSKLPRVKKDVVVMHKPSRDAHFIVPDSREGWCDLLHRVLEAFFVTGKSFTYSTVCVRGHGEAIKGFGGTASGPIPLIGMVAKICALLSARAGRSVRPVDAADVLCCIGEMVVAGNVRRSALLLMGDQWDKDYLRMKRWDLGVVPSQRAMANFSIVSDDLNDVHPSFWKTYEHGEPYGIINRTNIQRFGRMGEEWPDTAVGVNPCGEATLESNEPCVSGDTLIMTRRHGIKPIRELVGLEVEVWNGRGWRAVRPRLTGQGQKLFRVLLSDGSHLDATAYHGFSVKDRFDHEYARTETSQLMTFSKYPVQVEPFQMEWDGGNPAANAYELGVMMGDGFTDRDVATVDLFGEKQKLPVDGRRRAPRLANASDSHEARVRVHCAHLDVGQVRELRYGGVQGMQMLAEWDRPSILAFFAGWIDTDGSETKAGGVRLYISQRERAQFAQLLLSRVGVKSSLCLMTKAGTRTNKGVRKHDMMYLQITDARAIDKTARVDTSRGHVARTKGRVQVLRRVEELPGLHDVFCFEEPERHMGVFGNVLTYQCNLQEIALPNLDGPEEFVEVARLMHRWGKRVTMEHYHNATIDEVVKRNRRIGTGITGCLRSALFARPSLDAAYRAIQDENRRFAREDGVSLSARTTVVKPAGTSSKLMDCDGYEGIHPAFSRYFIQRVRFASDDPLVPMLREAGHYVEPLLRLDNTVDHGTVVADFYARAPEGAPIADEDWDTWKQLDTLKMAQRHWADQAVSVTAYYKREELPQLKEWMLNNLNEVKTVSFLCHSDHGFKQAPKEAITREQYDRLSGKVRPIELDAITDGATVSDLECAGGICPIR